MKCQSELTSFFQSNSTSDTSLFMLWESNKVFIRRLSIFLSLNRKKATQKLKTKKFKKLQSRHKENPMLGTEQKICNRLDLLEENKT